MKFNEAASLIVAFILVLPFMLLIIIAGAISWMTSRLRALLRSG